jgi:hypothetical protein
MRPRAFLDGPLRTFAEAALGASIASAHDLSWPHGEARVVGLRTTGGRRAVLKAHRTAAKHRREVAAYRGWAAQLSPWVAPLLAVRDEAPAAILLGYVPGRPGLAEDDPAAEAVHREAGVWLARLHRTHARDDDPLPLAEAYRRRSEAWIARARDRVPAATLRSVRSRWAPAFPALDGRPRVPCHRDMGPRNWLVADGRLRAVIDFEHARPDVAEVDFARLATTVWPRRPELRAAFLAGYDGADGPGDPDAPWVPGLLALEALGTVVWAVEHGDAASERRGREALTRGLEGTL